MLELRFAEISHYVDFFVIVEADFTFAGQKKSLKYPTQQFNNAPSANRVIYLVATAEELNNKFTNPTPWDRESFHRNYAGQYLSTVDPNSIVLLSDVDEIPDFKALNKGIDSLILPVTFQMCFHYYNLHWRKPFRWAGTVILRACQLKRIPLQSFRDQRSWYQPIQGGWHLSYFMSAGEIADKIRNFSHQEFNLPQFTNEHIIKYRMDKGEDLFDRQGENLIKDMMIELNGKTCRYWPNRYLILPKHFYN